MAPEERQREIERIRAWRLVNPTVPAPPRVVKCATVLCEGTFAARGNGRFCLDCRRFNNVYASERSRLAKRRAREAARQAKRSLDYLEQGG